MNLFVTKSDKITPAYCKTVGQGNKQTHTLRNARAVEEDGGYRNGGQWGDIEGSSHYGRVQGHGNGGYSSGDGHQYVHCSGNRGGLSVKGYPPNPFQPQYR